MVQVLLSRLLLLQAGGYGIPRFGIATKGSQKPNIFFPEKLALNFKCI